MLDRGFVQPEDGGCRSIVWIEREGGHGVQGDRNTKERGREGEGNGKGRGEKKKKKRKEKKKPRQFGQSHIPLPVLVMSWGLRIAVVRHCLCTV